MEDVFTVRDLSLHILDLIENSIRAAASSIAVTVAGDPSEDTLTIRIDDNGHGFKVAPEVLTDPFFTTKDGKRTGLGLSLFRATAERAEGKLTIGKSELGGAAVEATMQLSHVDRSPMGDLAATIASVVCTNPDLDLSLVCQYGERKVQLRVFDLAKKLSMNRQSPIFAQIICEKLHNELGEFLF
jgi:hypothetical protein